VSPLQWEQFSLLQGDISDLPFFRRACVGADFLLHHAALGSVPGSIADPVECHRSNTTGFLNALVAARDGKVKRLVYASSSAVYGDDPQLPKVEHRIGAPLSPYAATKAVDELYAGVFALTYGLNSIGLRYFNVFGPRQDPQGAYAAVIPKWISALLKREPIYINGDGGTTRDFCYVENVVQANLLAATVSVPEAVNQVYNIALGEGITLNELFQFLQRVLLRHDATLPQREPIYRDFRAGDVRHSIADISKACRLLGFEPTRRVDEGLELAMTWYLQDLEAGSVPQT